MVLDLPQDSSARSICLEFLNDERNLTSHWFGRVEFRYISQHLVDDVASAKNINTIVSFDESLQYCDSSTKRELVAKIAKSGKQVFVICILSNVSMQCLRMMLETDPVTDSELPIARESITPGVIDPTSLLTSFLDAQFRLIDLDQIPRKGQFDHKLKDDATIPISYDKEPIANHSAAGTVFKMDIIPSRSRLSERPDQELVIKVSDSNSAQAEAEREFLQALAKDKISHPHITTSYTGFTFKGQYYVVSERGSGDLFRFMKKYANSTQAGVDYDWIVQQFRGLAEALDKIHGPTTNGNTGFHHDIKPHNILVFVKNDNNMGGSTLKFCDWGCAKMSLGEHSKESIANVSYKPPEATGHQETSTPHDIWSLGCVFLEVLVWFHDGASERIAFVKQHGEDHWVDVLSGSIEITSTVKQKMNDISGKGDDWKKVVDEIRRMLHVDPQKRSKASDVVAALH